MKTNEKDNISLSNNNPVNHTVNPKEKSLIGRIFRWCVKKVVPEHWISRGHKAHTESYGNKIYQQLECKTVSTLKKTNIPNLISEQVSQEQKEDTKSTVEKMPGKAECDKISVFKKIDGASGVSGQVCLVTGKAEYADNIKTARKIWAAKIPHEKYDDNIHKIELNDNSLDNRMLDQCDIMKKLGKHDNIIGFDEDLKLMEYAGVPITKLMPVKAQNRQASKGYEECDFDEIDDANTDTYDNLQPDENDINHGHVHDKIPSNLVNSISKQLFTGIKHMHDNNVIHLDVKPANLLISPTGVVKIADFGCSSILKKEETTTCASGDKGYMPPEAIIAKSIKDHKVDVWSAGAVVYELLGYGPLIKTNIICDAHNIDIAKLGRFMADSNSDPEVIQKHIDKKINDICILLKKENPLRYSNTEINKLNSLLKNTLSYDYQNRITAENALNHQFFNEKAECDEFDENALPEKHDMLFDGSTFEDEILKEFDGMSKRYKKEDYSKKEDGDDKKEED